MTSTATNIEQHELPAGWKWVKLGDVGDITDGDWILSKNYSEVEEVRLLRVGDIGKGIFIGKSDRYILEQKPIKLNILYQYHNKTKLHR